MKIAIGCDHAAWEQKAVVANLLRSLGHEVLDEGTHGAESVDYPDFALAVSKRVASGEAERGVLLCGSGIGISIAANKVDGIRAALVHEPWSAAMARAHNDANIVCFGARATGIELIKASVEAFLSTAFEGGKHQRRVEKITAMEGA